MEKCPLCGASAESEDSVDNCRGCGLSKVIGAAIQDRRRRLLLRLLKPPAPLYPVQVMLERKSAFSYVDTVTRHLMEEGTYSVGKLFVGCKFLESGAAPPIFESIYRVCQRFGLEAQRFFAPVEYPGVAVEALKAIEDAEFLIFDLSENSPNVYGELLYALACGNTFE